MSYDNVDRLTASKLWTSGVFVASQNIDLEKMKSSLVPTKKEVLSQSSQTYASCWLKGFSFEVRNVIWHITRKRKGFTLPLTSSVGGPDQGRSFQWWFSWHHQGPTFSTSSLSGLGWESVACLQELREVSSKVIQETRHRHCMNAFDQLWLLVPSRCCSRSLHIWSDLSLIHSRACKHNQNLLLLQLCSLSFWIY